VTPKSQTPHAPSSQNNNDDYLIPILSHRSVKIRPSTSSRIEKPRNNNKNKLRQPPPTRHNDKANESRNLHIIQPSLGLCLTVTGFAPDGVHLVRYVSESASNHKYVYGCGGSSSSSSFSTLDMHAMVRDDMAPKMTCDGA